jgi:hypothetical protein
MRFSFCIAAAFALAACSRAPMTAPTAIQHPAPARGAAAPSCPADNFDDFLVAFAADDRVRRAYTAPHVDVTDWVDVDETGLGTETVRVPREKYEDFKLRHRGGRYVHVEFDDVDEPIPVEPKVAARPGGYRVEYIFNMSEGNSWMFARTEGCWQLVADPDPSLL